MVASFFDRITRLSLRFRWVVIVITLLTLAAGVVSMTQLNLALLPSLEFPQTFIVIQWSDAETVDAFLDEVTIPVEEALTDVNGVVNIESTTSSGFAFVSARYEFGVSSERVLEEQARKS